MLPFIPKYNFAYLLIFRTCLKKLLMIGEHLALLQSMVFRYMIIEHNLFITGRGTGEKHLLRHACCIVLQYAGQ